MVNTGREEFDFSFESVVPSYDTPVYHDKGTLPKKGGGPFYCYKTTLIP